MKPCSQDGRRQRRGSQRKTQVEHDRKTWIPIGIHGKWGCSQSHSDRYAGRVPSSTPFHLSHWDLMSAGCYVREAATRGSGLAYWLAHINDFSSPPCNSNNPLFRNHPFLAEEAAAMATQPSNAEKTHHRDVGRKIPLLGFLRKGAQRKERRRTKIGEGGKGWCDWSWGAFPADGWGCPIQTWGQTHKPTENTSEGAWLCETPSTYTNTLPLRCPVQKSEDRNTTATSVSLMRCSLQTHKQRVLTCSDQNVDFITESFFYSFPLLEDHMWNSIFFEKRGNTFNGMFILSACKFVWKHPASTQHCDVAVKEDTGPTHSLIEQQTGCLVIPSNSRVPLSTVWSSILSEIVEFILLCSLKLPFRSPFFLFLKQGSAFGVMSPWHHFWNTPVFRSWSA